MLEVVVKVVDKGSHDSVHGLVGRPSEQAHAKFSIEIGSENFLASNLVGENRLNRAIGFTGPEAYEIAQGPVSLFEADDRAIEQEHSFGPIRLANNRFKDTLTGILLAIPHDRRVKLISKPARQFDGVLIRSCTREIPDLKNVEIRDRLVR